MRIRLGVALAGIIPAAVLSASLQAQEVRVDVTADSNSMRVGEQVRVTVTVGHPAGFELRGLAPADSLGALEIVRVDSVVPSAPSGGAPSIRKIYTLTSFDTGTHVLPPFTAWYTAPSDTTVRAAQGSAVAFHVRGVEVDTSAEIRAIKPPLGVPLTIGEVLPYVAAVVALVLAAWLIRRYLKKRKRGEPMIAAPPARPADQLALEALRSLEAERLWQRGLVKQYHTALSDILRIYVERQFSTPAMESTTGEILGSAPIAGLEADAAASLGEVLTRSDLVKFAKFVPPPEQNEQSLARAVAFVERTGALKRSAGAPVQGAGGGGTEAGR